MAPDIVAASVGWLTASVAYRSEIERVRAEYKTQYMAEDAITQLLSQKNWQQRYFSTIKHHVRGFSDDELRQLLVRSGAVAFDDDRGEELWGLCSRNADKLAKLDDASELRPSANAVP